MVHSNSGLVGVCQSSCGVCQCRIKGVQNDKCSSVIGHLLMSCTVRIEVLFACFLFGPVIATACNCRREHGKRRCGVWCEEAADVAGTLGRVADVVNEPVSTVGSLLCPGDQRRLVSVLTPRLLSHLST